MAAAFTDNYSPIPVLWSYVKNEFIVDDFVDYYFHCDCHNLLWHNREMVPFYLEDSTFFRCDLPIETAI